MAIYNNSYFVVGGCSQMVERPGAGALPDVDDGRQEPDEVLFDSLEVALQPPRKICGHLGVDEEVDLRMSRS